METKKSNRANLEKKRSMFFQLGLLLALGVAFVAFEWQSAPRVSDIKWEPITTVGITEIDMIRTMPEPPPSLPEPPRPSLDLEIVDNAISIDNEPIVIDVEHGENPIFRGEFKQVELVIEGGDDEIFPIVEDMPLFNGKPAEIGFREYIRNSLNYPQIALENGVSGTVFVQFVVDQNGNVTDAQITRGSDPSLEAESLRLINASPKWTPGKQRGKAVKVRFTFPIAFKLQ